MAVSQAWAVPVLPPPRLALPNLRMELPAPRFSAPELQMPPPIRVPLQRQDMTRSAETAGANPLAARAAKALSSASDAAPQGEAGRRTGSLAMRPIGGQGGITIQFAPTITVQSGAGAEVKGAVMEAAHLSLTELERMIRRVVAQQQRREN